MTLCSTCEGWLNPCHGNDTDCGNGFQVFVVFKENFLGCYGSTKNCYKNKQTDLDFSLHQVKEISVEVFIYYIALDSTVTLFHEMF